MYMTIYSVLVCDGSISLILKSPIHWCSHQLCCVYLLASPLYDCRFPGLGCHSMLFILNFPVSEAKSPLLVSPNPIIEIMLPHTRKPLFQVSYLIHSISLNDHFSIDVDKCLEVFQLLFTFKSIWYLFTYSKNHTTQREKFHISHISVKNIILTLNAQMEFIFTMLITLLSVYQVYEIFKLN